MEPCTQTFKIADIEKITRETNVKVDALVKSQVGLKEDIFEVKGLAESN